MSTPVIILFPKSKKKSTRTLMFACPNCDYEYEAEVFSEIDYDFHSLVCKAHHFRHLETDHE